MLRETEQNKEMCIVNNKMASLMHAISSLRKQCRDSLLQNYMVRIETEYHESKQNYLATGLFILTSETSTQHCIEMRLIYSGF